MTFHVGQKVVCVDDGFKPELFYSDDVMPRRGEVYTIRDLEQIKGYPLLRVCEIRNKVRSYAHGRYECAFHRARFRPIVEKKTDTGFAILEDIRKRESEGAPAPRVPAHTTT